MLNASYGVAKLFGEGLGRRIEVEFGDKLWVYPSGQSNMITVWIEPSREDEEPTCVVLTPKQLGDFIAAARSQAALSQMQYQERQKALRE